MRIIIATAALFLTLCSYAQPGTGNSVPDSLAVDSSRILQTITLPQKYVLHFLAGADWNNPDVFNVVNEIRTQLDTIRLVSDTLITLHPTSALIVNGMRIMAALPEGMASDYNQAMLQAIFPQVTNPWVIGQMIVIQRYNWAQRDARIQAIANKLLLIRNEGQ